MAELHLLLANFFVIMTTDRPSKLASIVRPRWYATYTCPRHEKSAKQHLEGRAVETFLPVYDSTRNWNGRRAVVQMPLFPGYLFVRILESDRMRVLETPGVIRIVGSNGRLTPLPDDDIEALASAVKIRKSQPHPFVSVGKRVRIKSGALRGLEGVVVREARELRMIVSIDSIMRSFSVELEPGDFEICSPEKSPAKVKAA